MYKLEHKKLPNAKYYFTYHDAEFYRKVYGLPKSAIKIVH